MNVTVPIPDEFAARFGTEAELGRHVLEVLALDEYRSGRLSKAELGQVLGFGTPGEIDAFLHAREVDAGVALVPTEHKRSGPGASDLVERFRAFSADKTLGGIDPMELIREGRR